MASGWAMNTDNEYLWFFFIRLSGLVSKSQRINKNHEDGRFLFIRQRFETKWLSRIKKIINIHYQCSLPWRQVPPVLKSTFKFQVWHLMYSIVHNVYIFYKTFTFPNIFSFLSFSKRWENWIRNANLGTNHLLLWWQISVKT